MSIAEAMNICLEATRPLAPGRRDFDEALGCVLGENVVAPEDVPPFANSAMDGYAVRTSDTADAPVALRVVDTAFAGRPAGASLVVGEAVRIMTGAMMPDGADGVSMVELTHEGVDGATVVIERPVAPGQHVRSAGGDLARGALAVASGTVLGPAHLGILASVGATTVVVHPRPRVGVMSTGSELVEGPGALAPGQIRESNRHVLLGLLRSSGFDGIDLGIVADDRERLGAAFADAATSCDAIVTSGGVSVGDADLVREVLFDLCGGTMRRLSVAVKPAKPFVFGVLAASGLPVFGLPGNPVSSFVSFELFARPALRRMAGHEAFFRPVVVAVADEAIERSPDGKVHLVSVRARSAPDGLVHVVSAGRQASHVLSTLGDANALAILEDGEGVGAGERVELMLLDADRLGGTSALLFSRSPVLS